MITHHDNNIFQCNDARALFLDINYTYINPTRELIRVLFKTTFNTTFFGPGFTCEHLLKKGLHNYIESYGPFDLIVATDTFLLTTLSDIDVVLKEYTKAYSLRFNKDFLSYCPSIANEFYKINLPKIITIYGIDFYNLLPIHIKFFENLDAKLLTAGREFFNTINNLPFLQYEIFNYQANDLWFEFIERNQNRIISLPHFVGNDEFSWVPIEERKIPWSIVGVDYWARKKAMDELTNLKIKHQTTRKTRYIMAILNILKINPYSKQLFLFYLNYAFKNIIVNSRYSYTCGSGVSFPVRKFFEIPAAGAVLVCMPCCGFDSLGFINNYNAIECLPQNIRDIHEYLEQNIDKAQDIANKGRQLIWDNHSLLARSRQLSGSYSYIKVNNFQGSFWDKGCFYLKTCRGDLIKL